MIKYFIASFLLITTLSGMGMPSDYYKIKNSKAMKEYFFTYMSNLAYAQNRYILDDRQFIRKFFYKKNITSKLNAEHKRFIKITKQYRLKTTDNLEKYLSRIDTIPVALVLAQASVESGWGKSRFTRQANNLFGQWTWSGKGLIPKQRDEGKTHRIKIFPSIESAIRAYMLNLNRNSAYKQLQVFRANQRKKGLEVTGLSLCHTLINYSQIREEYIVILKRTIKVNRLERFDK